MQSWEEAVNTSSVNKLIALPGPASLEEELRGSRICLWREFELTETSPSLASELEEGTKCPTLTWFARNHFRNVWNIINQPERHSSGVFLHCFCIFCISWTYKAADIKLFFLLTLFYTNLSGVAAIAFFFQVSSVEKKGCLKCYET